MGYLTFLVVALAVATTGAGAPPAKPAPVCSTQRRASDAPYQVGLISDTLLALVSQSRKGGICAGTFPSLPNESVGQSIRRSNGSLVVEATRHAQRPSLGQDCVNAFKAIILSCIEDIAYWGGNITSGNIQYAIFNDAYPKNWVPVSSSPNPPASKIPAPKIPAPVSSGPNKAHSDAAVKKPSLSAPASVSKTPSVKSVATPVYSSTKTSPSLSQSSGSGSHGFSGGAALGGAGAAVGGAAVVAGGIGAAAIVAGGVGGTGAAAGAGADGGGDSAAGQQHPAGNDIPLTTLRHTTTHRTPSSSSRPPRSSSTTTTRSASSSSSRSSRSSSTTPALPLASNRVITPRNGLDPSNAQLMTKLQAEFGYVLEIANPKSGVIGWSVAMTDANRLEYLETEIALVKEILPDLAVDLLPAPSLPPLKRSTSQPKAFPRAVSDNWADSSRLQKRTLEYQSKAPWQLTDLSYPPYGDPLGDTTQFVYNSLAGSGSTIYFFETGANGLNPDYRNRPQPATSIVRFPPGRIGDKIQLGDSAVPKDNDGRGSCAISIASGLYYGVAKKANTVLYQIPQTIEGKPSLSSAVLLNVLNMILLDVLNTKSQKNVLVISWAVQGFSEGVYYHTEYHEIFSQLASLGVVITIAAGNGRGTVNGFPGWLANSDSPMILVGASDKTGHIPAWYSSSSPTSLLAPGSDIICASNLNESSQTMSGSAYSASLVGGLAAYLFAHPYYSKFLEPTEPQKVEQIPGKMENLIRELAWPSYAGGPKLAFNGADWYNEVTGPDCNPLLADPSVTSLPSNVPRQRRKRSCPMPTSSARPILAKPQPSALPPPPPHSLPPPPPSPLPPPPPSSVPLTSPQPPPGKNCGQCGDACLVAGATCVAACLLPPQSMDAPNKCGDCMAEAKASAYCISCWQECRGFMPDRGLSGFDCSDQKYFRTCKGYTKYKWLGEDTGLCTQPGGYALYEANPVSDASNCTNPNDACDLRLGATTNCLASKPVYVIT